MTHRPPPRREQGYALVAAVAAILVLSALALAVVETARMATFRSAGELGEARAAAAADAGLAIIIHALVDGDARQAALVDGQPVRFVHAGAQITIRLADARGRIPLNRLDEDLLDRVLERQGLTGEARLAARDGLLDWLDDDDLPRAQGAELADYSARRIAPRNGPLWSLGELAQVHGIGPGLAARLAPFSTVDPAVTGFDAAHADPRALAALEEGGGAVTALIRQRELAGARTALGFSDQAAFAGRPLLVTIEVQGPGFNMRREATLEIMPGAQRRWRVRRWE